MAVDLIARDAADLTRRSSRLRFRSLPVLAFLGDSLSQFGKNVTATQNEWTNSSYIPWLRRLMRDRFQTSTALNFGVASQKTDHFVNVQVPAAITAGVDIALVQIGTNDIGSFSLAQSIANVRAGISALNAAGIVVVLLSIAPQSSWGAASRQQAAAYNHFLHALARDRARSVRFVDINPVYMNYGTGNALSGYQFSDNVHDSPVGGHAKAALVWQTVDDLLPRNAELLTHSALAQYDATLNPNGNLLLNGLFTGTAGQKSFGPTGNVADNWNAAMNNSGGTTWTVAAAKGTDANNASIPTQILTLGGTDDGKYLRLRAQSVSGANGVTIPAGIGAGSPLVFQADVSWTGLSGIRNVALRLECSDGATTYIVQDGGNFTPSGTTAMTSPPAFAGLFRTDALILPTGVTTLNASIEVVGLGGGAALGGTLTIARASIRQP